MAGREGGTEGPTSGWLCVCRGWFQFLSLSLSIVRPASRGKTQEASAVRSFQLFAS